MEFLLNFRKTLSRFWSPIPAVIALGVLSAYYFGITGTYWAVTGEFTRWMMLVVPDLDYSLVNPKSQKAIDKALELAEKYK